MNEDKPWRPWQPSKKLLREVNQVIKQIEMERERQKNAKVS